MAVIINAKGTSISIFQIGKDGNFIGTDATEGLFSSTDGNIANLATIKVASPVDIDDAASREFVLNQFDSISSTIFEGDSSVVVTDVGSGTIAFTIDGTTRAQFAGNRFDLSSTTILSASDGTVALPAYTFETDLDSGLSYSPTGGPASEDQVNISVDGAAIQKFRVEDGITSTDWLTTEVGIGNVRLIAEGSSTDINIRLEAKGLGQMFVGAQGTNTSISASNSTADNIDGESLTINAGDGFSTAATKSDGGDVILIPGLQGGGSSVDGVVDIQDANDQSVMQFVGVASSVNFLTATNSATGNGAILSSTGSDTDVDLILDPQGTGLIIAPSGYDMSNGPNEAFATKTFVENIKFSTTAKTAAYTTVIADDIIFVNTSTGVVTITLGSAAVVAGKQQIIKDFGGDATTNNITVDTEAAETIDGAATQTIINDFESLTIISDGTNWFII